MKIQTLLDTYEVVRNPPKNIKQKDLSIFQHELNKKFPDVRLLALNNISITCDGFVFQDNEMMEFAFPSRKSFLEQSKKNKFIQKDLKRNLQKKAKYIDKGLYFIDINSYGYFHWILDTLPRLFLIKDELHDCPVILPYFYKKYSYIIESLKLFKVKVIFIKKSECLHINQVLIPERLAPSGNYNADIISDMKNFILEKTDLKGQTTVQKKIYVSRAKANRRKIVNEDEIFPLLKKYNYRVVYFEDYTWLEQIKLMANANQLLSIHGAGLSNMLFMQPDAKVLEIRREGDHHQNCFFSLASALNYDYYYLLCKTRGIFKTTMRANLYVDTDKFADVLALLNP